MTIAQTIIDEIEVLMQFDLDSTLSGIKIHHGSARPGLVEAAERLFNNGFIDQVDGGYLTELGHEAAEHIQSAIRLLRP
ncbi:MAG: TIGR02647 family protein [Methylophaga sp.]|nr:TIGR02647 family protein [Methylophaga sp.]